jgi:hypothetical protein
MRDRPMAVQHRNFSKTIEFKAKPVRSNKGVDAAEVSFDKLGYAREARASYLDFCAAKERGELPRDARCQAGLRRRRKGGHHEEIAISL